MHDVFAGAPEPPAVAVLEPVWFGGDDDGRLLVAEEEEVAVLGAELAPGSVDVDPETGDDAT